eukprot:scaffold31767_cov31-Tisochrysis_lutea.AAC.2
MGCSHHVECAHWVVECAHPRPASMKAEGPSEGGESRERRRTLPARSAITCSIDNDAWFVADSSNLSTERKLYCSTRVRARLTGRCAVHSCTTALARGMQGPAVNVDCGSRVVVRCPSPRAGGNGWELPAYRKAGVRVRVCLRLGSGLRNVS